MSRRVSAVLVACLLVSSLFSIFAPRATATALTPHSPILIDGNSGFTAANGVTGGTGTASDPYVISGWKIDWGSSSFISLEIRNTTSYFVLRSVYVNGGDGFGVLLSGVANARIESSTVSGLNWGLKIESSVNVTLSGNNFGGGYDDSAIISGVSNLSIIGNEFGSEYASGVSIGNCKHAVFSGNRAIAGKWGVPAVFSGCSDITVSASSFSASNYGALDVGGSSNVNILNNNVYGAAHGIGLGASSNVIILGNNVTGALTGITISSSAGVLVYHNNLINNSVQAEDDRGSENVWDNGYPSGGNFWSDYAGVDHCSGPGQDVCTGGDGIGDTPRIIDSDSRDRYPLMKPFTAQTSDPQFQQTFTFDGVVVSVFGSLTPDTTSRTVTGTVSVNVTSSATGQTVFSKTYSITVGYGSDSTARFVLAIPASSSWLGAACTVNISSNNAGCSLSRDPDLNHDGAINILDVAQIAFAYDSANGDSRYNASGDLNADGLINILDAAMAAFDYQQPVFS